MPEFVGTIDQGTTSTRFMIFDHEGVVMGAKAIERTVGWVDLP
jgi:glycerol kinase